VPNTKDGIGNYYRHVLKFNNINGSMSIRTSMDIGRLKQAGSAFRMYLQSKIVYINKAQLGIEEGGYPGMAASSTPRVLLQGGYKGTTERADGRGA
jgi:hypothetical protein